MVLVGCSSSSSHPRAGSQDGPPSPVARGGPDEKSDRIRALRSGAGPAWWTVDGQSTDGPGPDGMVAIPPGLHRPRPQRTRPNRRRLLHKRDRRARPLPGVEAAERRPPPVVGIGDRRRRSPPVHLRQLRRHHRIPHRHHRRPGEHRTQQPRCPPRRTPQHSRHRVRPTHRAGPRRATPPSACGRTNPRQ